VKEMSRINPKKLKIDKDLLEDTSIRGELDIEALVFRQIERTHQAAIEDESIFAANVRLLMNMLPSYKKNEVIERSDEYMSVQSRYEYKYNCNVPLGTPEHPICGSPWVVEEEVTDWYKLLEIVLEVFEECGVTWKTEAWTVEVGKVNAEETRIKTPTPVYKKDLLKEEPKKRFKRCAVCGLKIERGTGTNYQGKLVHRDKCLRACKAEFLSEKT
jgi:hypothetical protein